MKSVFAIFVLILVLHLECIAGNVITWQGGAVFKTPANATNIIKIAAGSDQYLALRDDGKVIAWNLSDPPKGINVPNEATNVIAIAAGKQYSMALRADRSVVVWGYPTMSEYSNIPENITNVVAIAAGQHPLVLREDGTVATWGGGSIPTGLSNVIAINAKSVHCTAIKSDGAIVNFVTANSSYAATFYPNKQLQYTTVQAGYGNFGITASGELYAYSEKHLSRSELGRNLELYRNFSSGIASIDANPRGGCCGEVAVCKSDGSSLVFTTDGRILPIPFEVKGASEIAIGETGLFIALVEEKAPRILGFSRWRKACPSGAAVPLSVRAVGEGELTYRWYRDGVLVPDWNRSQAGFSDWNSIGSAAYQVLVSNKHGAAISEVVDIEFGKIHAWGRREYGKSIIPDWIGNPIRIATGGGHTLSLYANGEVKGWGKNSDGQISIPDSATNVIGIAAGSDHSLAIKSDGTVVAWGRTNFDQTIVPPDVTNIVSVSAGWAHSVALRADGTITAWGNNEYGQASAPVGIGSITSIASGFYHNIALRIDGTLIAWGLDSLTPESATNVIEIAAGFRHSLALKNDRTVIAWGDNSYGQCDVPNNATNIVSIAASFNQSVAITEAGEVISWGKGSLDFRQNYKQRPPLAKISCGEDHCVVLPRGRGSMVGLSSQTNTVRYGGMAILKANATVSEVATLQWFYNGFAIKDATNICLIITNATKSDSGQYHFSVSSIDGTIRGATTALVLTEDQEIDSGLTAWGDNRYDYCNIPKTAKRVTKIESGGFHTLGILATGEIISWGKTNYGQVNQSKTNLGWIQLEENVTNAIDISGGFAHSLVALADGRVVGFGDNHDRQSLCPVNITNAIAVSAGWAHSVALLKGGHVIAWGNNEYGQTNVPPYLTNVTAISAGYYHTLALLETGEVVSWGSESEVPGDINNIVEVSAGWGHSVAVDINGKVYAWGDNSYGQTEVPSEATNIVSVVAGYYHNLALRADGQVISWGKDFFGVSSVPRTLRGVSSIAIGEDFSVALSIAGAPKIDSIIGKKTAPVGGRVVLSARIKGTLPITYRWTFNGHEIDGATNSTLVIENIRESDSGEYRVLASNRFGEVISDGIEFNVDRGPEIDLSNRYISALPGDNVRVTAEIFGSAPIRLRWLKNGQEISDSDRVFGVNSSTLEIKSAHIADGGRYQVCASNQFGLFCSKEVEIAIAPMILWGDSKDRKLEFPPVESNPVLVSSGYSHSLAVLSDGKVVTWGDNSLGQCNVPSNLSNVIFAATGDSHNIVLKKDGTAVAWGDNFFNQASLPDHTTNVVFVSAAGDKSLIALGTGEIIVFGNLNQFKTGPIQSRNINFGDVKLFAGGQSGFWLTDRQGKLFTWRGEDFAPVGVEIPSAIGMAVNQEGVGILLPNGIVDFYDRNGAYLKRLSAGESLIITGGGNQFFGLSLSGRVVELVSQNSTPSVLKPAVIAIASGNSHCLALYSNKDTEQEVFEIRSSRDVLFEGESANFFLSSDNGYPGAIRWIKDGSLLNTETSSRLLLTNVSWNTRGEYSAWRTIPYLKRSSNFWTLDVQANLVSADGLEVQDGKYSTSNGTKITIRNPFKSGQVFYTVDGSDVSTNSLECVGPIDFDSSIRLRTLAVSSNGDSLRGRDVDVLVYPKLESTILLAETIGGGLVRVGDAGIGQASVATIFEQNSVATVSAIPNPGWQFIGWTGDSQSTDKDLSIKMVKHQRVRAVFGTPVVTEVVGDGILERTPDVYVYPYGTRLQLGGRPHFGRYLLAWLSPQISSSSHFELQVTNSGNRITAVFGAIPRGSFALATSVSGMGEVDVVPSKQYYSSGEFVSLKATPNRDQEFLGWGGDFESSLQSITIQVDRDYRLVAKFSNRPTVEFANKNPRSIDLEGVILTAQGTLGETIEFQKSKDLVSWFPFAWRTNLAGVVQFNAGLVQLDGWKYFRASSNPK